jgi:LuxR family maltose regulon positive regulatory protein
VTYVREFEYLTFARVLIAQGEAAGDDQYLQQARSLLDRLLDAARTGGRVGSAIESLVLLAAVHQARADTPAATTALASALRLAEPEGHIRLFLHAGASVTEVLRALASSGGSSYAAEVLAASELAEDPPVTARPPRAAHIDALSDRELDVLRLLRSDLSGPEIARELHVSLNTLRTHTKHIYTKLGATNRREALTRAGELGL